MNGHLLESLTQPAANCGQAQDVVRQIRQGISKPMLSWMAERSYVHPNGFHKLVVGEAAGHILRLHIWPTGFVDSDAHSHRWNFKSFVMQGGLRQSVYEEASNGQNELIKCEALSPANNTASYKHTQIGRCSLVLSNETQLATGSDYWMSYRSIHRLAVIGQTDPALTLMLTSPPLRRYSYMYTTRPIEESETLKVMTIDEEGIVSGLEQVATV